MCNLCAHALCVFVHSLTKDHIMTVDDDASVPDTHSVNACQAATTSNSASFHWEWNGSFTSTPCPRKKQATLIFDITSPSVEIFLQFLKHFV